MHVLHGRAIPCSGAARPVLQLCYGDMSAAGNMATAAPVEEVDPRPRHLPAGTTAGHSNGHVGTMGGGKSRHNTDGKSRHNTDGKSRMTSPGSAAGRCR